MSDQLHRKQLPNDGIHAPFAWKFPSEPDRLSFLPSEGKPTTQAELTSDDLNRLALQTDDNSVWFLTSISPVTWFHLNPASTFSGSIIGGGDFAATYLVLSSTSSLANERVFSISGSSGLRTVDNGPGNAFVLSLDSSVVATLSGSTFAQLTGSVQQVSSGVPYLLSQGSITITTMSNGQIVISGSSAGSSTTINVSGGDPAPTYLVLSTTASLLNERVFSVSGSSGLRAVDTGPNGTLSLSINDNIVATLSGSTFTGALVASGGISGSLQKTPGGLSYLVAAGGISITSQSNGQIVISGSAPGAQVTAGSGISVSGAVVSINDAVVATLSGSQFTGPVVAGGGLSGSLQRTSAGLPYLLSQGGITLTTQSNGQIIISGTSGGNGSSPSPGTGIIVNGSQVSINDNVVATLSGSTFTGQLIASGGLTGSLQKTPTGLSYLVGVGAVSVTSQSNGQIFISGSGDTTVAGLGLTKTGATLAIDTAVVATLSGSTFSGPVNAQAGLTGSIQQIAPGVSYLVGVGSVFITSQSNGQIIISGSGGGGGGGSPPVGGTGILITGGNIVNIDPSVVAQLSDASFTRLSGSLQRLPSNQTYIAGSGAVTVVTSSTGQIIISASSGVTPQSGVGVSVSGTGVVSIIDGIVATISGSNFSGPVVASGGLSGSLQRTSGGLSYLVGVGGTTITSQSNGQILVSSSAPQAIVAGSGISVTGSTVSIDPSIVAQLSNAAFVKLSGSLQRLTSGETYIAGSGVVSVTTSSIGQVIISGSSLPPVPGQGISVNDRTVSIDQAIVATLSGSTFVQLSGSLQKTSAGLSYLVAGQNITVTSQSNGQVIVGLSPTLNLGADVSASYVTIGNTGSLPNERSLTAGTGLTLTDGGVGSTVTLGVNNSVVATLSGAVFSGPIVAGGGLSGSLQQISPGVPYLLSQGGITLTTMSNGQVIISGSAAGASLLAGLGITVVGSTVSIDPAVVATLSGSTFIQLSGSLQRTGAGLSYLVAGQNVTITSQSNGQVVIASTGGGASPVNDWIDGGNKLKTTASVSISSDNNYVETIGSDVFFYVSGTVGGTTRKVSVFAGDAVFSGSIKVGSGSVTITSNNVQFTDVGTKIERSGSHLRFYDQNNPTGLTLTALGAGGSGGGSGDPDATYLVVSLTGSLNNERSLAGSSGIILTDGGPNSSFTISINNNVVATLSGSTFTGPVVAGGGLTGSLQRLATGETAFAGVGGTSVTTQSNGQVVISSSAPTTYQPGTGLTLVGSTFNVDYNTTVARSGSAMTGPLVLSGGLTGSLQKTIEGLSYLVGVGGVTVTSQSNGQILLSGSTPLPPTAGTGVVVLGQQVSVDPNVVAMRSGSSFQRLSASIQQTDTGLSYIVGAGNVSVVSQSNGQIVISGSSTPSTAGLGVVVSGFQVSVDPNVVVLRSGSSVTGPLTLLGGVTGSLQRLSTGETYLAGAGGVTVSTGSNGQVQISGSAAVPPVAGLGIVTSNFQVSIDPSIVVARSGSSMSGPLTLLGGLSGSLQRLSTGETYIAGAGGVVVTTGSNGQVQVSGSAPVPPVPGTGIIVSNFQVSVDANAVVMRSGSSMSGPLVLSGGLTGSLQQTIAGLSYLVGVGGVSIVSQSNGQIFISSSNDTTVAGTGLIKTSNAISINDAVVATVSGTTFTGVVRAPFISGSLQRLTTGETYIAGSGGISVTTGSSGQVVISGSAPVPPTAGSGVSVSNFQVSVDPNVVVMRSGSSMSGPLTLLNGLTGSLQQVAAGVPYLLSQGGITITTQSNGQVIISGSSGGGGAAPSAGTGILVVGTTVSIDPAVVATLSGSTFVQLSGSLQRTAAGLSYLVGSQNVTITSQSNGQIVIASSFTSAADVSASYVTIGNTGSLPNERSLAVSSDLSLSDGGAGAAVTLGLSPLNSFKLTQVPDVSASYVTISVTGSLPNERSLAVSSGLTLTDGGAGGSVTFGINNNVLATISGSSFSGPVIAGGGLSGSLQRTSAGLPYLLSQGGITLTTQSNGQIIISGASGGGGGSNPVAGTGILVVGSTVSIDPAVVATLSGSTFVQLSGSLQRTSAGLSYLVGAGAVTVSSQSNGQVILSSSLFDASSHASLRQLIHLAENGPYELIGSGSTLDHGPQPFPTASIWRSAGGSKIVEKLWTRNSNKTPSVITWKVYAPDGSTVLAQAQDTITYQGVFEISRTRTVI